MAQQAHTERIVPTLAHRSRHVGAEPTTLHLRSHATQGVCCEQTVSAKRPSQLVPHPSAEQAPCRLTVGDWKQSRAFVMGLSQQ